eukprot:522489_1
MTQSQRDLAAELFGPNRYEPPKKKQKRDNNQKNGQKAAAWTDPEDETLKIDVKKNRKLRHLRTNFKENELNATEYIRRQRKHYQQSIDDDWTKLEEEKESNPKPIPRSTPIIAHSDLLIKPTSIAFTDLGIMNRTNAHKSVVTVCSFDRNGKILMTAGLDKSLCLYSMESSHNELLKRLFINDLPIRSAKFCVDGTEIIMSGRRHFIYSFNLINFKLQRINKLIARDERSWELFEVSPNDLHLVFVGIRGALVIVSRKTKKPVKTLQISQRIVGMKFSHTGDKMYVLTENGIVYVFDMKVFRCVDKMIFEGIVKATCFDIFPQLNLLSIGCNSGVVSVFSYDFDGYKGSLLLDKKEVKDNVNSNGAIEALYSVNNLVTTINGIAFNHDGQLMVMWSKGKKEAIRLVHVETGKVYANWPKDKGLSYVYKATFSPHSGYLAIANDRGV